MIETNKTRMKFTEEELRGIEKQLSNPEGEMGIEIAKNMNELNIQMTIDSIDSLSLNESDRVLELGHGNCAHLEKILNQANDITYFGLEISETMKQEAERINRELMLQNNIGFHLYDGFKIPFPDNSFDKIFTVNTVYFWQKPIDLINEIHRVLKTNGTLIITFVHKKSMKQLPFVKDKFSLYDNNDLELLIKKNEFQTIEIIEKSEVINSKSGELIERVYSIAKTKKSNLPKPHN